VDGAGRYPIFYFTLGSAIGEDESYVECPACARVLDRTTFAAEIMRDEVNWNDPHLFCDDCGERIESAYAEDEAEEPTQTDIDTP